MADIHLQLIRKFDGNAWWKQLIQEFVKINDSFEIRCWKEEEAEIADALRHGVYNPEQESEQNVQYEASIAGSVSEKMLTDLLTSNVPVDQELYSKMTEYFTLRVGDKISSEHYGTEIHVFDVSEEETKNVYRIINPININFMIHVNDD